ncbi:MAG: glycosyltransferase family 4 protein [Planctomycetes bacterium]|nr:glycosyltransferase family 4 protein [Planctomycetota bacterium]
MTKTVALDLTPMNTGSRLRGIGRYVAGLASGVRGMSDADRAGLAITGLLSDAPWDAGPMFDPTLRYTGGTRGVPGPIGSRVRHIARRWTLYRRLRAAGVDLLHATEPGGRAPTADVPYVVTCYDLIPLILGDLYRGWAPFSLQRRERFARAWYLGARRVIAISESTRRDLVERIGVDPARVDVVPCGVDHERFNTSREDGEAERVRAALGTSRPFLLYVGAADARKNLPFLIEAYAKSGAAAGADLVLAGDVPHRIVVTLRGVAQRAGVEGRVLFAGFVPDEIVPAMYRTCLGHVFASAYEGFGLPVAEAMACGAPTATTFRTSLAEVAGDAALELPCDAMDGAAAAIGRLASDAALRDDLRRRGPIQARRFTWDACARGVVTSYRRALGG